MKPIWCTIFSVYFVNFIYNLYMFQTSPGPSSGGITVFIRHLVLYKSRRWTWRGPKHVEVINKIDEIYWEYCAPSWFHSQDYIEMHGQQNIKKSYNGLKKTYSD